MERIPSVQPTKGRGATSNRSGRFEREQRQAFDDGWRPPEELAPRPRTTVQTDHSRRVITRNDSPDVGFDQSINPYRGCEHGCAYCFARPTHAYLGLSPGLDFETRLFAKRDAAAILRRELAHHKYRCAVIALGVNTDAYQPIEREEQVTRRILEVLAAHNHPVAIITKSALVTRDIDILAPMAAQNLVKVMLSVTTVDRGLARRLEPRAATPAKRLKTLAALHKSGIPTGVMMAPIIPGLNDPEIETVVAAAAEAGASEANYVLLRLPLELKTLFTEWLAAHTPDRARRVLALMRDSHQGQLYDSRFGLRQTGQGPYAEMIRKRFAAAARRHGMDRRDFALETGLFKVPGPQLSLF